VYFYEFLFVRSSLFYLLFTGVLGVAFYLWPASRGYLLPVHTHAGLVGFFLNMVFGVAYWMMPRPGQLRQDALERLTYWSLNLGLGLRIVFEPLWLLDPGRNLRGVLVLSALLQLLAIAIFAYAMHQRVVTADMLRRLRQARESRKDRP